jgi:integrase
VDAVRARKPQRLPTVLTKAEALRVIDAMAGVPQLMAKLLYGSGLRALECGRLRVKDMERLLRPPLYHIPTTRTRWLIPSAIYRFPWGSIPQP